MKTCEKCGAEVPEEKAFCPNCGAAMVAERQRNMDDSEEMIETLYEFEKPSKVLVLPPTVAAAKPAQPSQPEPESLRRQPSVMAYGLPESMPANAPEAGENRSSRRVVATLATLFIVALLVVAVLYFTGRI